MRESGKPKFEKKTIFRKEKIRAFYKKNLKINS